MKSALKGKNFLLQKQIPLTHCLYIPEAEKKRWRCISIHFDVGNCGKVNETLCFLSSNLKKNKQGLSSSELKVKQQVLRSDVLTEM